MTTSASTANNIIPFPARGLFGQTDLFLASSATLASTTIVGLIVNRVHAPCRFCGGTHFIIGSSRAMHCAKLTCGECGKFSGWMGRGEYTFARMTVERSGMPTTPFREVKDL